MTFTTWKAAVAHLRTVTSGPSSEHIALAEYLGLPLLRVPSLVAAARLRTALSPLLALEERPEPSDEAIAYLADLARLVNVTLPDGELLDRNEFEAWLKHCRLLGRIAALESIEVSRGDLVRVGGLGSAIECVSSIGVEGALFFRGGGGARAWPDLVSVVARSSDNTEAAGGLRRQALNRAEHRKRTDRWSAAKRSEITAFSVFQDASPHQVMQLTEVVDRAGDEAPIQSYLQDNPQLLASLLRGPERFVRPQVAIGTQYVADFLLADADSTGIRWMLVELESPESPIALLRSNQFEKRTRKGISQIEEWREWLQHNLDVARRSQRDHGLGIPDIRPGADGLVLAGRRRRLSARANDLRHRLWESSRIRVHTYDWLIEQVACSIAFNGPPGLNPYLLER